MPSTTIAHPKIVSREEWLTERKALLADEKKLTQRRDRVNTKRRLLPMVKLDKEYIFEGSEGLTDAYSLLDVTPYGRQEDFEDSPPGWPQRPTYG